MAHTPFHGQIECKTVIFPSFIVKAAKIYSHPKVAVHLFFAFLISLFFCLFLSYFFPLFLSISKPKICPPLEVCGIYGYIYIYIYMCVCVCVRVCVCVFDFRVFFLFVPNVPFQRSYLDTYISEPKIHPFRPFSGLLRTPWNSYFVSVVSVSASLSNPPKRPPVIFRGRTTYLEKQKLLRVDHFGAPYAGSLNPSFVAFSGTPNEK